MNRLSGTVSKEREVIENKGLFRPFLATRISVAPMMDWTDASHPICLIKDLRSAESRVNLSTFLSPRKMPKLLVSS